MSGEPIAVQLMRDSLSDWHKENRTGGTITTLMLSETLGYIETLAARVTDAEEANEEAHDLAMRLGSILNATAIALKGEPGPMFMHSTHDLAEVATTLVTRLKAAEARGAPLD